MNKKNLTIPDYGEIYGPKRTKTYDLIGQGKLQTIKIGTRTYITVESAEAHRAELLRAQADASKERGQV